MRLGKNTASLRVTESQTLPVTWSRRSVLRGTDECVWAAIRTTASARPPRTWPRIEYQHAAPARFAPPCRASGSTRRGTTRTQKARTQSVGAVIRLARQTYTPYRQGWGPVGRGPRRLRGRGGRPDRAEHALPTAPFHRWREECTPMRCRQAPGRTAVGRLARPRRGTLHGAGAGSGCAEAPRRARCRPRPRELAWLSGTPHGLTQARTKTPVTSHANGPLCINIMRENSHVSPRQ